MGKALELILLNDESFMKHIKQVIIHVEQKLWPDMVEKRSFDLQRFKDLRIVRMQL